MGNLTCYIDPFGYIVLFAALLLELIALLLPGEILMSYTDFLILQTYQHLMLGFSFV